MKKYYVHVESTVIVEAPSRTKALWTVMNDDPAGRRLGSVTGYEVESFAPTKKAKTTHPVRQYHFPSVNQ